MGWLITCVAIIYKKCTIFLHIHGGDLISNWVRFLKPFQFYFKEYDEMRSIVERRPSNFNDHLHDPVSWFDGIHHLDNLFDQCMFWVQIWDLPRFIYSKKVSKRLLVVILGSSCVQVKEKGGEESFWFFYMHILVDINKLLPRSLHIRAHYENGGVIWWCFTLVAVLPHLERLHVPNSWTDVWWH